MPNDLVIEDGTAEKLLTIWGLFKILTGEKYASFLKFMGLFSTTPFVSRNSLSTFDRVTSWNHQHEIH
jgi:hypothetical protein